MLKVIGIKQTNLQYEAKYIDQVKNYNILTNYMSDECKPYRIHQTAMLWIDEEGMLGEIECIYPKMVESTEMPELSGISKQQGTPIFELMSSQGIELHIQYQKNSFMIWLAEHKVIHSGIESGNIIFLITAESELIGILCEQVIIE